MLLDKKIGHRGLAGHAPENTLAGVTLAKNSGFRWVEVDVLYSQDSVPVIAHDLDLNRCAGIDEQVANIKAQQLKQICVAKGFEESEYARETIPTLEELVRTLSQIKTGAVIELKAEIPFKKTLFKVLELCQPLIEADRLIFSSFLKRNLKQVRDVDANVPLALNVHELNALDLDFCDSYRIENIHVNQELIQNQQLIERVHATGRRIYLYTVNDLERYQQLLDWGADGVFTDQPLDSQ